MATVTPIPRRASSPWPDSPREILAMLLFYAISACVVLAVLFPVESRVYLHEAIVAVRDAVFAAAHLEKTTFCDARASRASFVGAHLDKVDFRVADLSGADFTEAYVRRADFSGAKVEGIVTTGAHFDKTIGVDPSWTSRGPYR